jgi:hypothetical protein
MLQKPHTIRRWSPPRPLSLRNDHFLYEPGAIESSADLSYTPLAQTGVSCQLISKWEPHIFDSLQYRMTSTARFDLCSLRIFHLLGFSLVGLRTYEKCLHVLPSQHAQREMAFSGKVRERLMAEIRRFAIAKKMKNSLQD